MRFSLVCLLFSSLALFAATNSILLDCGIEIVAVRDAEGVSMGIELFEGGMLSYEEKLVFMPDGKADASVNFFLVRTGGKTYMIDAGLGNAVKNERLDASRIDVVFLSHAHSDHVAGLLNDAGKPNFASQIFFSKPESAYWLNSKTPDSKLQKDIAKAYKKRYKTFSFGDTLVPGIIAIDASGHTPGHTAFLIGTGEERMLIASDFLHAASLQFPQPQECAAYDMDREKSVEMRKQLIQTAIDNNWYIAGMHIPLPGFGKVADNGKGGFEFTPGVER